MDISVAELRQKMADHLEKVSQGEVFYITSYGRRIAVLSPYVQYENKNVVQEEKDVQHLSDKEQKFQELKEQIETVNIPTSLREDHLQDALNNPPEVTATRTDEVFVGTCDICGSPSKELWEHEEDGVERSVCRNCFAVRMPEKVPAQFEAFLRTRRKVQWTNEIETGNGKLSFTMRAPATFKDFNPLPKPVKKEKKKPSHA